LILLSWPKLADLVVDFADLPVDLAGLAILPRAFELF